MPITFYGFYTLSKYAISLFEKFRCLMAEVLAYFSLVPLVKPGKTRTLKTNFQQKKYLSTVFLSQKHFSAVNIYIFCYILKYIITCT